MKNELRIGNYVYGTLMDEENENVDRLLCRVMGVDETSSLGDGWEFLVEGLHEEEVSFYDDFEPIPLTEEWLLKFGFKKDKVDETYYKDNFEIMLPNFFQYKISLISDALVKHVHQLQNLYFALTGQELTINDNH